TSNLSFTNKVMSLYARSPAAAACLRNYRVAPTYCDGYLFQWKIGNAGVTELMAQPLERNHLSVFAPHQRWSLQGDFVLDNVRVQETPDNPDFCWSKDRFAIRADYQFYRHLNLFLPTPDAISWKVSLPANVEEAVFHTALALSWSAPITPHSDG